MKLTGADVLKPGQTYSYNISLTEKAGGAKSDLKSLNLLKDNVLSTTPVEKRRLALGYAENQLPSFALPPDKLTDLKIIHGSCRLQVAGLTDGLAWIDDLIKDNLSDPNQRIHQLLLAGDQIYADDVEVMMLPQMAALGQDLLAKREFLAINEPEWTGGQVRSRRREELSGGHARKPRVVGSADDDGRQSFALVVIRRVRRHVSRRLEQ